MHRRGMKLFLTDNIRCEDGKKEDEEGVKIETEKHVTYTTIAITTAAIAKLSQNSILLLCSS